MSETGALAVADSVRLVMRARALAILDPLDQAVYAIAGPLQLVDQTFAPALGPGRFHRSGGSGVWYACAALGSALAEIGYHQQRRILASGLARLTVRLVEARAAFAGTFLDLRGATASPALDPNPAIGWPAGQSLASEARARRLEGIVWPSVRDPARGDAYAIFDKTAIRAPSWGACWQLPVEATGASPPMPVADLPLVN